MSGRKRRLSESSSDDSHSPLNISLDEIQYSPPAGVHSPDGSPAVHNNTIVDYETSMHCDISVESMNDNDEASSSALGPFEVTVLETSNVSVSEANLGFYTTINKSTSSPTVESGKASEDLEEKDEGGSEASDISDSYSETSSHMFSDDLCSLGNASELSFSGDDEDFTTHGDPPIYEGAPIKLSESMVAILSFVIRHNLSGKQIEDLLNLINLHCREDNNEMLNSLYFFKKYFTVLQSPVICHYYCSGCYAKLNGKGATCPNAELHPDLLGTEVFVELPLIPQLQDLFSQNEFYSNLSYPQRRKKITQDNIEDVYDGQLYKELIESKFLGPQSPNNFSLITNADGIPVFHSVNKSLWPIYLNVLELPPHLRFKQEYTMVAGLWFGGKPSANLMLSPLLPSLLNIRRGFEVRPAGSQEVTIAKGVILAATSDLPAKAMLLGMSSHSGAFGCHICKIKGESVKIEKKKAGVNPKKDEVVKTSSVWVFKYSEEENLRSHQETVIYSTEAQKLLETAARNKVNIFGVKFPSAMFKIMVDVIRGFSIDDLHTLYLGATKTLINLWFDSKNASQPFSIRKHLSVVDKRLESIKLPNFIERGVSSIQNELSYWKGKDYLTWAHYLSIPVLDQIMPDKYLEHYVTLISCLHVFQSSSISPEALISCSNNLKMFVKKYENLYGTRHMTMVIHLLQHLGFVVNNLGPLKTLSCFPYESLNGCLVKMIHGTTYIETQLASGCYLIRQLPKHIESLVEGNKVKDFCEKILHPSLRLKITEKIDHGIFSVGSYRTIVNDSNNLNNVIESLRKCGSLDDNICLQSFVKLKKEHHLFVARSYTRPLKTISYCCSFKHYEEVRYGTIDVFVKTMSNSNVAYFAIVEIAKVSPYVVAGKHVPHIMEYSLTKDCVAVPVHNLNSLLVYVEIGNRSFICEPLDHSLKS